MGSGVYEQGNHIQHMQQVVTDKKTMTGNSATTLANPCIQEVADYAPFGMRLPQRNASVQHYRYGYQGSESDAELKGIGNENYFNSHLHH